MTATRKSKKREAIYEVLCSTKSHPTAEWIYMQLKGELPDLSLGTVYRNLARFKEESRAISVATVGGQERFDGCTAPHAHFICRMCGAVTDVEGVDFPSLPPSEGTVEGVQLNYYGVCRDCEKCADAQNNMHKGEGIQ